MRWGKEAWMLAVLVVLFVIATAFITKREAQNQQRDQPTTYSAGSGGTKALFELLQRQGFQVERQEQLYTKLPPTGGLVIMFEPWQRDLAEGEQAALWKWVEEGGSYLLVVSKKGEGQGVTLENVTINTEPNSSGEVNVNPSANPLLQDVSHVWAEGDIRLENRDKKKQKSLISDSKGDFAITYPRGKGSVTVVTDGLASSNATLEKADNAVFFVNLAQAHSKASRSTILFDEYHQGFGYEGETGTSLWAVMGAPLRTATWYLLAVCLILIYSLNRRFGAPLRTPAPNMLPSTEYIRSMAGFYRRAQAAGIPFEVVFHSFVRDLAVRVDVDPADSPETVAKAAARRYGWQVEPLAALLTNSKRIIESLPASRTAPVGASLKAARAIEIEVFNLAQQIQEYRRKAELVRLN
jgi:hypothetical protein